MNYTVRIFVLTVVQYTSISEAHIDKIGSCEWANSKCCIFILQYSPEELRLDAEEVFSHVLRDSEFAGHFSLLNVEVALMAITDALYALYHSTTSTKREVTAEISVDACMIVSVLTQWLTRHLCKQLFQLMTPEALCMRHRKIPSSYIQNYLNHQHHFSLKTLVEAQVSLLDNSRYAAFLLVSVHA